ncbi:copper ion binding protein [Paenibacillus sp. FSL K6-2862]|uniref:copper ion binding protein n=1 Tax=Paenibacillus sp. FSL K6-2862 TaxID=2921484 RepID=UPI0030F5066A
MKNITLKVQGMSCQHCVNSIESALKEMGAVAKVDLQSESVNVKFEESQVSLERIKEVVEEQGYDIL